MLKTVKYLAMLCAVVIGVYCGVHKWLLDTADAPSPKKPSADKIINAVAVDKDFEGISDADLAKYAKNRITDNIPWNCFTGGGVATSTCTPFESFAVTLLRNKVEDKHLRFSVYYAGDRYFAAAYHDSEPKGAKYQEDGRLPFWFTWDTSQHKAVIALINIIDKPENEPPRRKPNKDKVAVQCLSDISGGKGSDEEHEKDPLNGCHKRDLL